MAPEVLRGQGAGQAADLYALGVLLYEALTGRRPFHEQDPHEMYYAILTFRPPTPRVLNAKVSEGVEALVMRALEKDPAGRPASAAEFLDQLRALVKAPAGRSLVS
jgi:eukaryotic-like serine/threonine-protein kinase